MFETKSNLNDPNEYNPQPSIKELKNRFSEIVGNDKSNSKLIENSNPLSINNQDNTNEKKLKNNFIPIENIFQSIQSFQSSFMTFNGYLSVFLECSKSYLNYNNSNTKINASDSFRRYLTCLQQWHPIQNLNENFDSSKHNKKAIQDITKLIKSNESPSHWNFSLKNWIFSQNEKKEIAIKDNIIYIPNLVRICTNLLPDDFSLHGMFNYFSKKDRATAGSFNDLYMLILLYHHYNFIELDSQKTLYIKKGISFPKRNQKVHENSINENDNQISNDKLSNDLNTNITPQIQIHFSTKQENRESILEFLLKFSRVEGKVIVLGKEMEFWIKSIMSRSIRFIEDSIIEADFNKNIENLKLKGLSMNKIIKSIVGESSNINNILDAIKSFCRKDYNTNNFSEWNTVAMDFLSQNYRDIHKALEYANDDLLNLFFERVIFELNIIVSNNQNISTLTTDNVKIIVNCYRILNQIFNIYEFAKKKTFNIENSIQKTKFSIISLQTTLKLLSLYGNRVIILSKLFKFLGNLYHFIEEDDQNKIISIFLKFSNYNWKLILKQSMDKRISFPFTHYTDFLRGIQRLCLPLPLYNENKVIKLLELFMKELGSMTDALLVQEQLPDSFFKVLTDINSDHQKKIEANNLISLTDLERYFIDFHLQHCRSYFFFSKLIIERSLNQNYQITTFEFIVENSWMKFSNINCIYFFMALSIYITCTNLNMSTSVYDKVISPNIIHIISGKSNMFQVVCSLIGVCQLDALPKSLTQEENNLLIRKYILQFLLFGIIFAKEKLNTHLIGKEILMQENKDIKENKDNKIIEKENSILKYYENHYASNIFSFRFIITNSINRFTKNNYTILNDVLHDIQSFSVSLDTFWFEFRKIYSLHSTLMYVKEPKLFQVYKTISKTLLYLLRPISIENKNHLISVALLKILGNLVIFSRNNTLELIMIESLHILRISKVHAIADQILPVFIQQKELINGKELTIAYYLDCFANLILLFSDECMSETIIPFVFICLKETWFASKANFFFAKLFKDNYSLKQTIIPHYISMVILNGSSNLLKITYSEFPILIGNIISNNASSFEIALLQEFINSILKRCYQENIKGRKDLINLLVGSIIQSTQTIPVSFIEIIFEAIRKLFSLLPESLKIHSLKKLHSTIVECVDYSRKEICSEFYSELCSNLPTNPHVLII